MPVARCSTLLLTRICLVEPRTARCPQDPGPATIWPCRMSISTKRWSAAERMCSTSRSQRSCSSATGARCQGSRPSRPATAATLPARSLLPSSTGRKRASGRPFSFRPRVEGTPCPTERLYSPSCPDAGRGFRRLSRRRSGQAPAKGEAPIPWAPAACRPVGELRLRPGHQPRFAIPHRASRFRIAGRWEPATKATCLLLQLGKNSTSLRKRTSSPAPGLPWGNATTTHLRLDGNSRDPGR
jgi:hypothetical protein